VRTALRDDSGEHDMVTDCGTRPLGLRHALAVYATPGRVFARVEDTSAYGWALVVLLVLVFLIGYTKVQTGLIDQVVDRQTARRLAELEESQAQLVDRMQLKDRLDGIRKQGEFTKTMSRLGAMAASPAYMLASFLLIASVLYAVVAMTGRKPEYHTLMSICVYAGFIDVAAYLLRLAMMFYYRRIDVDTSLAVLGTPGKPTVLAGIDPFQIWFWVLVAMGLVITHQLSRRMAVVTCVLLCLVGIGGRVAMAFASVT